MYHGLSWLYAFVHALSSPQNPNSPAEHLPFKIFSVESINPFEVTPFFLYVHFMHTFIIQPPPLCALWEQNKVFMVFML